MVPGDYETDTKNWTSTNSVSELTNALDIVKKTIQAFESINYDVRARILSQITILVPDEKEIDAKNGTSTNSAFELTNPLEMVKKNMSVFGIAQF